MKLDKTDITIMKEINEFFTVAFKKTGAKKFDISVSTFYRKINKLHHHFKPAKFDVDFHTLDYIPFLFILDYPKDNKRFDPLITFSYSPKCIHIQSIHTTDKIILITYFKDLKNLIEFETILRKKGFNPKYTTIESNSIHENLDLLESEMETEEE